MIGSISNNKSYLYVFVLITQRNKEKYIQLDIIVIIQINFNVVKYDDTLRHNLELGIARFFVIR